MTHTEKLGTQSDFVLAGPVGVSLTGHLLPTDDRVLDTSAQLSREFPFNLDSNSGNTIGVGTVYMLHSVHNKLTWLSMQAG